MTLYGLLIKTDRYRPYPPLIQFTGMGHLLQVCPQVRQGQIPQSQTQEKAVQRWNALQQPDGANRQGSPPCPFCAGTNENTRRKLSHAVSPLPGLPKSTNVRNQPHRPTSSLYRFHCLNMIGNRSSDYRERWFEYCVLCGSSP